MLRSIAKATLRRLGYSITRYSPPQKGRFDGLKLAPDREDKYKWLSALGVRTILDVGAHEGEAARVVPGDFP